MKSPLWTVRLTQAAERDFQNILHWSEDRFGPRQARVYATTLSLAIEALDAGPAIAGARTRDDIAKGIFGLHVARGGRAGRHFVMFRIARGSDRSLEVLRLLHDSMDPQLHLRPAEPGS